MAKAKRKTQRERAEAWAREVASLDTKGRVYLFAPEGDYVRCVYSGNMAHDLEGIRRVLVATWMRARRAKR